MAARFLCVMPFYWGARQQEGGISENGCSFVPLVECCFFSLSKSVCADYEDDGASVSRYMDAAMRREKGKLCLFKRKDKSFVSNRSCFCETIFRFSSHCGDD